MRPARFWLLAAVVLIIALCSPVTPASAAPRATTTPPPAGSLFTPVTPQRLLDTRESRQIGAHTGEGLSLPASVPANATAVVINLTGTDSTAPTYLAAVPDGDSFLGVSNLNLAAGETRANLVTVAIGTDGTFTGITIAAGPAPVDAIVDLEGYYAQSAGSGFTSLTPQRVLDTRNGTGPVQPGQTVALDLSSEVPAGTTAVTFNLTGTDPTEPTYITAWPDGTNQPGVSNLNLAAGATTPNLVTVELGADRKVDLFNHMGTVDLIADLSGYYSAQSDQAYYPLNPLRALDTRQVNGSDQPLGPNTTLPVDLSDWLPAGASAAVFNLTGTNVTAGTYLSAWANGQQQPPVSNLNLVAGQTSANLAVVPVSTGRVVDVYNHVGQVDVLVDLAGYFAPQLAVCATGCVYSFGLNDNAQLGDGVTDSAPHTATPAYGLSGVTAIVGSPDNGYALRSDGTVVAWGSGQVGRLGNGTAGDLELNGPSAYSVVPVQVTGLSDVVAIADGFALRNDGTVWAWGPNTMWRLGDGSTDDNGYATTPVQVTGLTGVVAIYGDTDNGYALRSDGTVWAWGANDSANLGDGTIGTSCSANEGQSPDGPNCASPVPVQVSGLTGVTKIGEELAVKSDGTVWQWGLQLDTPNEVPVQVPDLTGIVAVAAGSSDYALRSDGTVWAWGQSSDGTLGNGTTCAGGPNCYTTTPVQVSGLTDATAISANDVAGYALRSDGTVVAWGSGQGGELGDGQLSTENDVPVEVPGLSGVTALGDDGHVLVASA